MGRDTVGAKPSVRFTEYRGVRISGGSIACKHMEIAFRTERSVRIIVDGRINDFRGVRRAGFHCSHCVQNIIYHRVSVVSINTAGFIQNLSLWQHSTRKGTQHHWEQESI